MEEKAHLLAEWISDEAVYRTAPATPGLLNTFSNLGGAHVGTLSQQAKDWQEQVQE